MSVKQHVGIIFGTRPEAIKVAAVQKQCIADGMEVSLICTGQHLELLQPILSLFDMVPTITLDVMQPGQSLSQLTERTVGQLGATFQKNRYDYVLVQGDTTTAFAGALSAFYEKIPVGHIEAGLRTNDKYSPFPEEINRRLISNIADDHFAPTQLAANNLLAENYAEQAIHITGNTVIDALRWVQENCSAELDAAVDRLGIADLQYVLLTTHRRENFGKPLENILGAVEDFLDQHGDQSVVIPVHRNPIVRDAIYGRFEDHPRVLLLDAQGYLEFVCLMKNAQFIVTDSGGIQEEAPYLGKRVLVIRDTTERPEAIESGTAILVGVEHAEILKSMSSAHDEAKNSDGSKLRSANPFGDGFASKRITRVIRDHSE
ncbi:MAG: UDP-N-acetylglucosamine 2-epimerase (non-hydrolyzing) [Pseudomonadota bacterium]